MGGLVGLTVGTALAVLVAVGSGVAVLVAVGTGEAVGFAPVQTDPTKFGRRYLLGVFLWKEGIMLVTSMPHGCPL